MSAKVTVIVPVFNGEKYIESCLDSILNQEMKGIDVLVINDGSTDSTAHILDRYNSKHENLRVISQENKGLNGARATGLRNAIGDYVGWVDADDWVEPEMYGRMYDTAIEQNVEVVICDYKFYPKDSKTNKKKWFKKFKGVVNWDFIERNTQPWNKLVKKDLLDKVKMDYWIEYCHDGAYALVLLAANGISTLNNEFYNYRVGHTSMSSDYSNMQKYIDNVMLTGRQFEAVSSNGLGETWEEYYDYRVIYTLIQVLVVAAKNKNKRIYLENKKILDDKKFWNNPYTKKVLNHNHGLIRSFVLRKVFPQSYSLSILFASFL